MGMWRDSLRSIPPIGFFLAEIRVDGPCRLGRPQDSWLRQVEAYLKDMGMTGLASNLQMRLSVFLSVMVSKFKALVSTRTAQLRHHRYVSSSPAVSLLNT